MEFVTQWGLGGGILYGVCYLGLKPVDDPLGYERRESDGNVACTTNLRAWII